MTLNRYHATTIGAAAVIVALGLAVTTKTAVVDCIDDPSCNLNVNNITANDIDANHASLLGGWVETDSVYGKNAVYAGSSDQSVLNASGLSTAGGNFSGSVLIYGNLSVGGSKDFRIDHPMDPANRYLVHHSVESDDMKNIYDGVAVLDESGVASVTLPRWFDSLNRDFRYQLTAVGGPGANLYIAQEISKGQFKIAGGTPNLKVSWQVTAARRDASALKNRGPVEQEKIGADRGRYLDPTAFGKPESLRVGNPIERSTQPAPKSRPTMPAPKSSSSERNPNDWALACFRSADGIRAAMVPLGATGLIIALACVAAFQRSSKTE